MSTRTNSFKEQTIQFQNLGRNNKSDLGNVVSNPLRKADPKGTDTAANFRIETNATQILERPPSPEPNQQQNNDLAYHLQIHSNKSRTLFLSQKGFFSSFNSKKMKFSNQLKQEQCNQEGNERNER